MPEPKFEKQKDPEKKVEGSIWAVLEGKENELEKLRKLKEGLERDSSENKEKIIKISEKIILAEKDVSAIEETLDQEMERVKEEEGKPIEESSEKAKKLARKALGQLFKREE